ncbi:MAG: preprotein translocase subunit SecA [Alphaproteobacteria bacterium]|nr:preprotein translocase subunit SecA [Alphaproteobacteria bacterium]
MFSSLKKALFGNSNDRNIKEMSPLVDRINALEDQIALWDDPTLRAQTDVLRQKLAAGASLDELLPEAFATVREAAKRSIGQRHFDVQLMGGIVLHKGQITEMKTGEGKTLVATLAAYLNALTKKGVHVVTVNDYLAERDSQWMGQIYQFLGLTVGCIKSGMTDEERRAAYAADVTYATNNEIGFDYLRDNMKFRLEDMVQRDPYFAIVDEVDSILIDEARTPLVISGQAETSSELYVAVDKLISKFIESDFVVDEKQRNITLTDEGTEHAEQILIDAGLITSGSLFDAENISLLHHVNMGLRAHHLFQRDTHYMIKQSKIVIIDEFTGRAMEGRRFGEGLHQALEAREGLEVMPENQTLASITYQNLFRLYKKLAGMTGTAMTEAGEFSEIYGLSVVAIPTNKPVTRQDHHDEVYRTSAERDQAVIEQIMDCRDRGQPILVGTVSIEKSELLSRELKQQKIPHQVLNAKFHEQEAMIIADAGIPGSVTIATNMAGRGTDIQLGGNLDARLADVDDDKKRQEILAEVTEAKQKALDAGGLYVIGTERHESRRIDNQLRGRSGRQGDPGASKFYLSLQDDLMRIFGSERLDSILGRLGLEKGEAIIHPWINKAIEKAQSKVEARNFEMRKQLLKFDDVMNDQRKVIFEQRREIMDAEDVATTIKDMRYDVIDDLIAETIPDGTYHDSWDAEGMTESAARFLGLDVPAKDWIAEDGMDQDAIKERLIKMADHRQAEKTASVGADIMRQAEKSLLLQVLDQSWKEHLLALDHMKQSVSLRAYAQKNPLDEYKREAFTLFNHMLDNLRRTITSVMAHIQFRPPETAAASDDSDAKPLAETPAQKAAANRAGAASAISSKTPRNAPCPCGSGKKFKHCHGAL